MQKFSVFFDNKDDINFHLQNKIDFDLIFNLLNSNEKSALGVKNSAEFLDFWISKFNELGQICKEYISLQKNDNLDPVEINSEYSKNNIDLASVINQLTAWGLFKTAIPAEYGGYGNLLLIEAISGEIISRASPSVFDYIFPTLAVSDCIAHFGPEGIKQDVLPQIASGALTCSLAFTEDSAGSDLGGIKTYYTEENGSYRLFGEKAFVSNGEADLALVLAKNAHKSPSIRNLALFLVKRSENSDTEFNIKSSAPKSCLGGLPLYLIKFDNTKAHRLTKENDDTRQILQATYRAKVGRGFQALGLMEQCSRLAAHHAKHRKAWSKTLDKHEMITEKLLDMNVNTQAYRSLCYQTAYHFTYLDLQNRNLLFNNLSDKEKNSIRKDSAKWSKRLRAWLPLVKWIAGEQSFAIAKSTVQIYGVRGILLGHPAETLLRDSLALSIQDGTSEMQALMSMKDTLKEMVRKPSDFIEIALGLKFKSFGKGNSLAKKLNKCKQLLNGAVISLMYQMIKQNLRTNLSQTDPIDIKEVISMCKSQLTKFEDMRLPLLHAQRICEMKSIVAMAKCIVKDAEKDETKMQAAERFLNKNTVYLTYLKSVIEANEPILRAKIDKNNEKEFDEFAALRGL